MKDDPFQVARGQVEGPMSDLKGREDEKPGHGERRAPRKGSGDLVPDEWQPEEQPEEEPVRAPDERGDERTEDRE